MILFQNAEGGVAFGISRMDQSIPLPSGAEDETLQIIGRSLAVGSLGGEPGDLFGPYRKHIEHDQAAVEREGCIPGIEDPKKPRGKGEYPNHLLAAFLGAVSPPWSHLLGAAGKASFPTPVFFQRGYGCEF
jgi:hypothetical protein